MSREPVVHLVIPAFNEGQAIAEVVRSSCKSLSSLDGVRLSVTVVDDGSSDDTASVAKQLCESLPVQVLVHPQNRGLGAALQTGLESLADSVEMGDVVLTCEGDGSQPDHVLPDLVKHVLGGADVAIATPLAAAGGFKGVPWYRRFLSRGGNLIYGTLFPAKGLTDYTNLVRALSARVYLELVDRLGRDKLIENTGFEGVPELLLKIRKSRPAVTQIPLTIDFTELQRGSSMHVLKTIGASLRLCFPRAIPA